MKPEVRRTRRVVRVLLWVSVAFSLLGAGASGLWWQAVPMDQVLIQLAFYGTWAALLGSWVGGLVGGAVEEDACGELDMGVTSSMGAFVGAVAWSLTGNAVAGLALSGHWVAVWVGALGVTLAVALFEGVGVRVLRRTGFDARGRALQGPSPWRMRDRLTVLVTLSVLAMLGLTGFMAARMGTDLGHPVMIAPMMYAMTGGMLGGILGGWFSGLRDEHVGAPEHENSVMVAAMALMSGMMGAMPAAMVAGMLAIMGTLSVAVTAVTGVVLGVGSLVGLTWGRYTVGLGGAPAGVLEGNRLTLKITGMTCAACGNRVTAALRGVPGVGEVEVDVAGGQARVTVGEGFAGIEAVGMALEEAGYPAGPVT